MHTFPANEALNFIVIIIRYFYQIYAKRNDKISIQIKGIPLNVLQLVLIKPTDFSQMVAAL